MYVESSGTDGHPGNIQSGIAIANNGASTATITFELSNLDGTSAGLPAASITLGGNAHVAKFLGQIFSGLPNPFQGVLRISTTSAAGISIAGLRAHYNERTTAENFLITTTPPSSESAAAVRSDLYFPHLADGGGYTTQLIVFSGTAGQTASGTLQFFAPTGQSLNLVLTAPNPSSGSSSGSGAGQEGVTNCNYVKQSIAAYQTVNSLSVNCDSTYANFNSYGVQTAHPMMNGITQTILQVPIAQNFTGTNAWRIPLNPAPATTKTTALDGPIGIAINGIPIFNPCKQGGCDPSTGGGDTKVQGELDICNGHAGRADDYHYHAAPTCMMADQVPHYWDTHPIGWALDGYGIFGYFNPDGTVATRDNICGGNTLPHSNAPSGYAYHVTDVSPYVLSCFYGVPSPDLAIQGSKYSPLREPPPSNSGGPGVSDMTLNATAASLAIGGTTTLEWKKAGVTYQILYKRTSDLCWNFIFKTSGTTTMTADYCRKF
jgi:hypothetical protein